MNTKEQTNQTATRKASQVSTASASQNCATYVELAKVNFDPESLDFETIDECIAFCEKQPEPMAAVMAIVCANIRMGEFGVASDVARQAETMAICCPDIIPENR